MNTFKDTIFGDVVKKSNKTYENRKFVGFLISILSTSVRPKIVCISSVLFNEENMLTYLCNVRDVNGSYLLTSFFNTSVFFYFFYHSCE